VRLSLLVPLIAIVTLAAALSAAPATAAGPEEGTVVTVQLELRASNGLTARLETSEKEAVTLSIENEDRQQVGYEVQGQVTETGLKARFGRLGVIDVAFNPTTTLDSTEPSEGCTGAPRTLREGVFTGTIDFTGERNYVRLEGPDAVGSMSVISQWHCITGPTLFQRALRPPALRSKDAMNATGSLHALTRRCRCIFAAGVHYGRKRGRSIFYGVKGELREGMEIFRVTSVSAPASHFVVDQQAGTATLRPPAPLSGRATFRRQSHGPALWRSTIRVPLLGSDPLDTGRPGFRAALYPEYHFD
jgi:hypothetical protein